MSTNTPESVIMEALRAVRSAVSRVYHAPEPAAMRALDNRVEELAQVLCSKYAVCGACFKNRRKRGSYLCKVCDVRTA